MQRQKYEEMSHFPKCKYKKKKKTCRKSISANTFKNNLNYLKTLWYKLDERKPRNKETNEKPTRILTRNKTWGKI